MMKYIVLLLISGSISFSSRIEIGELEKENALLQVRVDSFTVSLEKMKRLAEANAIEAYRQRKIAEEIAATAKIDIRDFE